MQPIDWQRRMREDWDQRALEDAEHFIYTRDSARDVADFARSGEANYNQLLRPFLPLLLDGRPARACRAVEIGCGIGRMTEWIARDFGFVDAVDVSPVMIEQARARLGHLSNIAFHTVSGSDLEPLPAASADLVFSYIVFQHIPSRQAIEGYVRDAARVLKPGGAFKFQLNGSEQTGPRDTWLGETFSASAATEMLERCGFSVVAKEGAGTQYFVITAFKGAPAREWNCVLPGEPWAEPLLLEGFGPPVDASWRPVQSRARVLLRGPGSHAYLGIYFWPESCRHTVTLAGHRFEINSAGDHYLECEAPPGAIDIHIDPAPTKPPAVRIIGRAWSSSAATIPLPSAPYTQPSK